MDSTVAVQTKGFGFSFQTGQEFLDRFLQIVHAAERTPADTLAVSSPNQRSTRFSQLELVGTKWGTKRGCRFSQARTSGMFVGAVVIHHQMQRVSPGNC